MALITVLSGGCLCTQTSGSMALLIQGQHIPSGVISVVWASLVGPITRDTQKPHPRPAAERPGEMDAQCLHRTGGSRQALSSPVRVQVTG